MAGGVVEVAYLPDSAERFHGLLRSPWCVFLDSCRAHGARGRYDIISAAPYLTVTTRGPVSEVRGARVAYDTAEEPFALVKRLLAEREPVDTDLPFAGGAIGYFAYDLARRIEHLPARTPDDIGMPDMAIGLYDWALVVDHDERRAWLVSQGQDAAALTRWRSLLDVAACDTPPVYGPSFSVHSHVRPDVDREGYARAFHRIKHYIREGDCYQVNLTQRFSAEARGAPWDAYRRLRNINPAPFSAYMSIPEGSVLSSSPERFLRVRDGVVETKPIKGTRRRAKDPALDAALAEDLRVSVKDRAENVMIVDLLRNDLGKSCEVGSVEVPKLFAIESYATVHHLVSTVRGRLARGVHALDLLRGCFPGGSITGAPKLRAMQIIDELEAFRRSVYCGAIGYIGFDGRMDTNIAIRTLVCRDNRMYCWAGGGIVLDSDLDAEYQESLDKAAAMIELFVQAEALGVGS